MIGCDDVTYEITVLVPVTLRLTAADKYDARKKFIRDFRMRYGFLGEESKAAVFFPKRLTIKEVER